MSQVSTSQELQAQSEKLLQGPLKHARTAALALALVPLAAVAVTTQTQEDSGCPQSAGVCGTIFYDTNGNGIQDGGEPGISGVSRDDYLHAARGRRRRKTGAFDQRSEGFYQHRRSHLSGTTYTVSVQIPNGTTPSPDNNPRPTTSTTATASPSSNGNSVAHVTLPEGDLNGDSTTDFGFTASGFSNPGTGTPGYWKNHPEAWPVSSVMVGGVEYTKDAAIGILNSPVSKDKTYTMFSSLVPAMLNVKIGNDNTCVSEGH